MPIELTPGPQSYAAFDHLPRSLPGWANGPVAPGFGAGMPGTGPARAIDCLPGPNKCLPNGLRNPWAPYAGEPYVPSHVGTNNRQIIGGSVAGGSMYGGGMSALGAPVGGGMSVIAPGSVHRSVIAPRSIAGSVATGYGLGGMRSDDGWDGAAGRLHNGTEPDLTSTAGALPRVAQSASAWLYAPSSPANHARLSPQAPEVYVQPPMAQSMASRPRRMSMRSIPIEDDCHECQRAATRQRTYSQGERSLPPSAANGPGPYRKLGSGSPVKSSPLRPTPDPPLSRKVSGRSQRSASSQRHCSECST